GMIWARMGWFGDFSALAIMRASRYRRLRDQILRLSGVESMTALRLECDSSGHFTWRVPHPEVYKRFRPVQVRKTSGTVLRICCGANCGGADLPHPTLAPKRRVRTWGTRKISSAAKKKRRSQATSHSLSTPEVLLPSSRALLLQHIAFHIYGENRTELQLA